MRSVIALLLHGSLALSACSFEDARVTREREQLVRFPLGEIVESGEDPAQDFRPFPPSLQLLAPALGRGVCVPLDVIRPDGARDAPRWGQWTYEYVQTERKLTPAGDPLLCFGLIEETSEGLESQGEYGDNIPVGLWRFWYPGGRLRAEGSFNEGKLSGEWKFWLADGQPDTQRSGSYQSGELAR